VAERKQTRYTTRSVAKRYDQYCPIAHALCLVGERWALLVVRELLEGPKRYTDLAAGLPGVSTNVLAARLRDLEAGGIVQKRRLPPPAASTVYELTEYGSELQEVVYAIARWGARTLGPPTPEDEIESDWGENAFPALFNPERAHDLAGVYVLRIAGDVFTVKVEDGRVCATVGASPEADFDAALDFETFFGLASGDLSPRDAIEQGLVELEGEPEELERFFEAFSFAARIVTPTPTPVAI
jgi:DNA-binding HxlR family transcriptional regulator